MAALVRSLARLTFGQAVLSPLIGYRALVLRVARSGARSSASSSVPLSVSGKRVLPGFYLGPAWESVLEEALASGQELCLSAVNFNPEHQRPPSFHLACWGGSAPLRSRYFC